MSSTPVRTPQSKQAAGTPSPAPAPADTTALTPTQRAACTRLETLLAATPIVSLTCVDGCGRTTMLKALAQQCAGRLIGMRELVAATAARSEDAFETAITATILRALAQTDTLLIDDFQLVSANSPYNRFRLFNYVARKVINDAVMASGKRLIVARSPLEKWQSATDFTGGETAAVDMPMLTAADYAALAENLLGPARAGGIDFAQVYRYASMLNGHQLRAACELLAAESAPTAERFIEVLERHIVTSTTRLHEVEALDFGSLPGSEAIAAQLETHVVLPLTNRALAQRLELKPKRGVLLHGPAGTGKTSIGRALAHRIKGKFFLIDGSFVTEPPMAFFAKLESVVQEAKRNAPAVLFIDDADVLFQIEHIQGLSRYLLTLLDGLESETASNVCVMMTAMDVKKIPQALLRSGRVELWLETKAPGADARANILKRWVGRELPGFEAVDYAELGELTENFTPADLRRVTGDAKLLYAADTLRKQAPVSADDYLKRAIEKLVATRSRMATSLGDDSLRVGSDRVKKSGYAKGVGGAAMMGTCPAKGW